MSLNETQSWWEKNEKDDEKEHDDDDVVGKNFEDNDVVIGKPDDSDEKNGQICNMQVIGREIKTGCLVNAEQLATLRLQTFCALENIETDDEDDLQCQIHKKRFSHATKLHPFICTGAVRQKDLVHYSLVYAYKG